MVPYLIALISCFFLSASSLLARYSQTAGYPSIQFSVDFSFVAGFMYLIAFVYEHWGPDPYQWECVAVTILAGFFCIPGFLCLNLAVLSGKGALAGALSQTQSFFWLMLDIIFQMRFPQLYEVFSMALGIAGAAVITLSKK